MEQTQIDRHEKKFLIKADQVAKAKEIILANTKPDEHADHYMANTMYWDSEGLSLYKSSVEQAPIRFKLRARWYGDDKLPEGDDHHSILQIAPATLSTCRNNAILVHMS